MVAPSSSSSAGPCGLFSYVPQGRFGIGVAQSHEEHDYPLVLPSEDVRYLLADVYLSLDDPGWDGSLPLFQPPFRIYWLYGFGCEPAPFPIPAAGGSASWSSVCSESAQATPGCMPIPVNAHDIVVVDAENRIVFDSTVMGVTYSARDWGDRLRIVTWQHPTDACCTVVYHTAWPPDETPTPRNYPVYFFPQNATLDARTVEQLPRRLRSVTVLLDRVQELGMEFRAGYNMKLTTKEVTRGLRKATQVIFDATPGEGEGKFPDCQPDQLYIRTINGVPADKHGGFTLTAKDCYWVRRPTRLLSTSPRQTAPETSLSPGNIPTPNLPAADAGTSKNAAGWPANLQYADLQIGNDCGPCADCDDYVAVADYMNTVRNQYKSVGQTMESARDTYHANRTRWERYAACITDRPIRLRMLPQICPFMDVVVQFCNQSSDCLRDIELAVTFETNPATVGTIMPGYTTAVGVDRYEGRVTGGIMRYKMGGGWPTYTAFFETVMPFRAVSARFRLRFPNCTTSTAITGTATGTREGSPILLSDGTPASVSGTWTLDCPITEESVVNLLQCTCI